MKIDYQDHGVTASLTITSSVFEFRKHNRVVDTALFLTNVTAKHTGFFIMKSALSGKTPVVMRAYKVALQEMAR
ncbi:MULTISPECIES: hypothetical protein [unclassified Serratia (in: enterobacteria)]|uniref:hypothetical protein n=1 Tax=unclassified Serratia (in: enterobacteria) TaxID=2647522 RepID=UPI001CBB7CD4|nr:MULTISPECIES: hypothetical protein [unclassified Serratia (in: enterobacteria)]UAN58030.1 hypothetical protein KGP21_02805 [Serratia sp. JSRIV004]